MDVIVIGKSSVKDSDGPQVIYCGQSRSEARDSIAAAAGKFRRIYEVNPLPLRPYKVGAPVATEPEQQPEPEPATITEEPKTPKRTRKTTL